MRAASLVLLFAAGVALLATPSSAQNPICPWEVNSCQKPTKTEECSICYAPEALKFPFSVSYVTTVGDNSTTFTFVVCSEQTEPGSSFDSALSSFGFRVENKLAQNAEYIQSSNPQATLVTGCSFYGGPSIVWTGSELGALFNHVPSSGRTCAPFQISIFQNDGWGDQQLILSDICQQDVLVADANTPNSNVATQTTIFQQPAESTDQPGTCLMLYTTNIDRTYCTTSLLDDSSTPYNSSPEVDTSSPEPEPEPGYSPSEPSTGGGYGPSPYGPSPQPYSPAPSPYGPAPQPYSPAPTPFPPYGPFPQPSPSPSPYGPLPTPTPGPSPYGPTPTPFPPYGPFPTPSPLPPSPLPPSPSPYGPTPTPFPPYGPLPQPSPAPTPYSPAPTPFPPYSPNPQPYGPAPYRQLISVAPSLVALQFNGQESPESPEDEINSQPKCVSAAEAGEPYCLAEGVCSTYFNQQAPMKAVFTAYKAADSSAFYYVIKAYTNASDVEELTFKVSDSAVRNQILPLQASPEPLKDSLGSPIFTGCEDGIENTLTWTSVGIAHPTDNEVPGYTHYYKFELEFDQAAPDFFARGVFITDAVSGNPKFVTQPGEVLFVAKVDGEHGYGTATYL